MQRLLFLILLLLPIAAHAQSTAAQSEIGYLTYTQSSTCANPPCFVGYGSIVPITASISGFTATSVGTPISVTTAGVTGTLPAGTDVVASNVGSTNDAYCALGASTTTAWQDIPPKSWFRFSVGASTQLTCITSTATTTVNLVGGSGLPAGSGGSGGPVTANQGTAAALSGAWPEELTDGTNGPAAVKAASTAAVAADKALVVALSPNSPLPPGTNEIGGTQLSPTLTTPSGATLTRPANTTAYAGTTTTPQLIASSTTAGSIAVPSFAIGTSGGYASIPRATLSTNATTGWGAVTLLINLWVAAPTYTNGDGGTYAVATGAASWRVQYSCTLVQYADGASCSMIPLVGNAPVLHPSSGTAIYWDIEIASSATPISGQTYTLVPEIWN